MVSHLFWDRLVKRAVGLGKRISASSKSFFIPKNYHLVILLTVQLDCSRVQSPSGICDLRCVTHDRSFGTVFDEK